LGRESGALGEVTQLDRKFQVAAYQPRGLHPSGPRVTTEVQESVKPRSEDVLDVRFVARSDVCIACVLFHTCSFTLCFPQTQGICDEALDFIEVDEHRLRLLLPTLPAPKLRRVAKQEQHRVGIAAGVANDGRLNRTRTNLDDEAVVEIFLARLSAGQLLHSLDMHYMRLQILAVHVERVLVTAKPKCGAACQNGAQWSKLMLIYTRIVRMIAGPEISNVLALRHNLTCKAVRDIWNMRTWQKVTCKHWTQQDQQKILGNLLAVYPLSYATVIYPFCHSRMRLSPVRGRNIHTDSLFLLPLSTK